MKPTGNAMPGSEVIWEDWQAGLTKFTFDTGQHAALNFDLADKKGFLCFTSTESFGTHAYPFRQVRLMSESKCSNDVTQV